MISTKIKSNNIATNKQLNKNKTMKEIWSNRYTKKKTEGLHKWLEKNVKEYKRQDLQKYINGFSFYLGKPTKFDTPNLASENFNKWTMFVLNNL